MLPEFALRLDGSVTTVHPADADTCREVRVPETRQEKLAHQSTEGKPSEKLAIKARN